MTTVKNDALEKLKIQQQKIAARIQSLESRNKSSERKKDVRRKILVGAYYLDQAQKNHQMDEVKNHMATFLKRNSDRQLFDLPPLAKDEETPEA